MSSTYKSYHHLSEEGRVEIEAHLEDPIIPLTLLTSIHHCFPKCIRYEVKKHRYLSIRSNQHNECGKQTACTVKRLCIHCVSGI